MMLESLRIHSFGALADASFSFEPGLNVILGPNEAGKSTLFEAIRHTLLTPSRLTRKQFQATLERFLPAAGGDTVSCDLRFSRNRRGYTLRRRWGRSPGSELELADGGRLTGEEGIADALRDLLPAGEGTLRGVLLTSQSGLARTLQELREDSRALFSLSDLLHRAVLETDGVSVARFRDLLESSCKDYFEHWDRKLERPEGNRGPGNPYKKGVGRVLAAWYRREELRGLYRETADKEDAYGSASRDLEEKRQALGERERWLQANRQAERDARERARLEGELEGCRREEQAARKDVERWPVLEERKRTLEAELPGLAERLTALTGEKQAARSGEQVRALRSRLERIEARERLLREAEEALASCTHLTREDLQKLRDLDAEKERLAAGLAAGRLRATLRARAALTVSAEVDFQEARRRELAAGEEADFEAGGRLVLEHPDWSLELMSGTPDSGDRARELSRAEGDLRALFAAFKIDSLDAAVRLNADYEERKARRESARANLEAELEGDSIDDLRQTLQAAPQQGAQRPLPDVLEELVRAESREREVRQLLQETELDLERLAGEHGGRERLWEKLSGLAARRRELEKSVDALAPIPEGFADAAGFIAAYERAGAEAERYRRSAQEQEIACARLEASMPEESSEEVELRLREAERAFSGLLEKGEALARVQAAAEALVAESGELSRDRYGRLLSGYIREVTGGAYRDMQVDQLLPAGLVRESGLVLPAGLLSAGTMDSLALSLRLAMAELFLAEREGFLILDDPLVDLDPQRQEQAAAAIIRFARERQLLFFTCHPGQAELFREAHRLELPRLQG